MRRCQRVQGSFCIMSLDNERLLCSCGVGRGGKWIPDLLVSFFHLLLLLLVFFHNRETKCPVENNSHPLTAYQMNKHFTNEHSQFPHCEQLGARKKHGC